MRVFLTQDQKNSCYSHPLVLNHVAIVLHTETQTSPRQLAGACVGQKQS